MPPRKPKGKPPTPPKPKPWDRRPIPAKGDDSPHDLYRAVGMALTSWEWVEGGLAQIFELFINPYWSSASPARRAYGAVTAFASRMEMIEAAGEAFFHPFSRRPFRDQKAEERVAIFEAELEKKFQLTMNEVRNWAARRNDIAHGIVGSPGKGHGYFLGPPHYNSAKRSIRKRLPLFFAAAHQYVTSDVAYYNEQFRALYERLHSLHDDLFKMHGIERSRQKEHEEWLAKMRGRP